MINVSDEATPLLSLRQDVWTPDRPKIDPRQAARQARPGQACRTTKSPPGEHRGDPGDAHAPPGTLQDAPVDLQEYTRRSPGVPPGDPRRPPGEHQEPPGDHADPPSSISIHTDPHHTDGAHRSRTVLSVTCSGPIHTTQTRRTDREMYLARFAVYSAVDFA